MSRHATIVIAACLMAGTVRADPRIDAARAQVEAADTDYKLGRFTDALQKYSKAYELFPAAPLLFNIGQCHKNLKEYDKAIFFFEGYLRDDPTASNHELVQDLIRESKAGLEQQRAQRQADAQALDQAKRDGEAKQAADQAKRDAEAKQAAEAQRTEADAKRRDEEVGEHATPWLPMSLTGGGLGVFAGGVVFYAYGQKRGPSEMFVYDDTRILGGTMMVLGVAAAATGTVLLFAHRSSPHHSSDHQSSTSHHQASTPIAAALPGGVFIGWAGEL